MTRKANNTKVQVLPFSFEGHIDDLKDLAEEIRTLANDSGSDLSKHLGDAVFQIEVAYQAWHDLDPDNWEKIEG